VNSRIVCLFKCTLMVYNINSLVC